MNPHCSLVFLICLFFNEIDAKVLDGTRLCRFPRVRGVNLHVCKADGFGVLRIELLLFINEDPELDLLVHHFLGNSDLGPFVNCGGREVFIEKRLIVKWSFDDKAPAWLEEDSRVPVAKICNVFSDCHVEDAGPFLGVIVGRLEQELHQPLAWQGWQSGQQVVLGQDQFLLDLVDGIPQPA